MIRFIIREIPRLAFVILMVWTFSVWASVIGGAVSASRMLH